MDATEKLQFIVDLANKDLADIREGDLINLQDDFERFFEIGDEDRNTPGLTHYNPTKTGKRYPVDKLMSLQKELKPLLSAALSPPYRGHTPPMDIKFQYLFISPGIAVYAGEHRDLFLLKTGFLLGNRDSIDNIRQCEPCGRFFQNTSPEILLAGLHLEEQTKKPYLRSLREKAEREKAKAKKKRGKK